MGDNQVSDKELGYGWENPGTLNQTYGYSKSDDNWKSTDKIIRMFVDIASKGGNYLLNVGPTADGLIQPKAVDIIETIGKWMDINSESIYKTEASPIGQPVWGRCTARPDKLYLHVFDWPENRKLEVKGIKNEVEKAYLLADPEKQALETVSSESGITIELPTNAPDAIDSVVVLEIK
jgi:alpha-L-fucosidase